MSSNGNPTAEKPEKTEGDLFAVMTWATAFSFAVLAAFLASIQDMQSFTLSFGFRTILGFVLGGAAGWGLWQVVRKKTAARTGAPR